jgi:rubredoxin
MSANNWAICPQCEQRKKKLEEEVKGLYGQIPAEDYLRKVEELKTQKKDQYTLREDYEIGIYQGRFNVNYRGSCEVCGFTYNYEYRDKIQTEEQS